MRPNGLRPKLLDRLRSDGVRLGSGARAVALGGGVSSDIFLVRDGRRCFVVKSALEKLRVAKDWRCDPVRNRYEQRYLRYVGTLAPGSVPRVLFGSETGGYFAMEYLGAGFRNWKTALLRGDFDPRPARQAMRLLARIHAASRGRAELAREFATVRNFRELRTDPYFRTAARRHPRLSACLRRESARLERAALCLVHGDFSPKNILVGRGRVVLLDCEVAWYGDPAFDVAFLLHHLCLKALYQAPDSGRSGAKAERGPRLEALFDAAVAGYFAAIDRPSGAALPTAGRRREAARAGRLGDGAAAPGRADDEAAALDRRAARLVLMLLLARIDGKSPVEYLTSEAKRDFVRRFVSARLPAFDGTLADVRVAWFSALGQAFAGTAAARGRQPTPR